MTETVETKPASEDEVREALNLHPDTPVVACDVRDQKSALQALIALVQHLMSLLD